MARLTPERPVATAAGEVFSPLELNDRVVIMAIFYEIVRLEHVEKAWEASRRQKPGSAEPLWRVLCREPGVDREAVFEVAAQIYGFETAEIQKENAVSLIQNLDAAFSPDQWVQMTALLVVPVAVGEDPRTGQARLIFATPDPTRPEAPRLLQAFELDSFELQYASTAALTDLLKAAFAEDSGVISALRQAAADPVEAASPAPHPPAPHPPTQKPSIRKLPPPQPPVPQPEPVRTAAPRRPEEDGGSLVDWFESVLVATHLQGAAETHIYLNSERDLEVFMRIHERLVLWREEKGIRAEGLLAYLMDDVIRVDRLAGDIALETTFQRWINSNLIRFHLAIQQVPGSHDAPEGKVIIRVLGHREAASGMARGMGPWKPI